MHRPAILSLSALVLLVSAPALAQDDPSRSSVLRKVERIQEKVAEMRGLEFRVPVRVGMKSRDQIETMVVESFEEEMPAEEVAGQSEVLEALGLIPQGYDLRAKLIRFLTNNIGGYYDHEAKELFLVDSSPGENAGPAAMQGAMQEMALAHELHHALQDQHFGLGRWFDVLLDHEDRLQGYKSLVEGEAQLVGMKYLFAKMGRGDVDMERINRMQKMALRFSPEGAELRDYPPYVVENLMFPYTQGAEFVQHIRRTQGWERLTDAFVDPPSSTEQVLHPAKYLQERDEPTELELVGMARTLGSTAAVEELYANTLGEFNTSLVLRGLGVDEGAAAKAAAGWDGDTAAGYRTPDGRAVVVWLSTWDSEAEAAEFERTYRQALAEDRPEDHLERRGSEVLMVHGASDAELPGLVRNGFGSVTYELDFDPLALFSEEPPAADFVTGEAETQAGRATTPEDAGVGLYRADGHGVSFEVPEGFTPADEPVEVLDEHSVARFTREQRSLRLLALPLPFAAAEEELEGLLSDGLDGIDVVERRQTRLLGRDALQLEFRGELPDRGPRRFALLAVGSGTGTAVLAASAPAAADPDTSLAHLHEALQTLWIDGAAVAGEPRRMGGVRLFLPEEFVSRSGAQDPIVCTLDHESGARVQVVALEADGDLRAATASLEEQLPLVLEDFELRTAGIVKRNGRSVHEIDFEAGGRRTRQVTIVHDGRRYSIACSAPADGFAALQPAFGRVLAGFRVAAGSGSSSGDGGEEGTEGQEDGEEKLY